MFGLRRSGDFQAVYRQSKDQCGDDADGRARAEGARRRRKDDGGDYDQRRQETAPKERPRLFLRTIPLRRGAVQGRAGRFVKSINGSFSAIVGLPLLETANLLEGAGYRLG